VHRSSQRLSFLLGDADDAEETLDTEDADYTVDGDGDGVGNDDRRRQWKTRMEVVVDCSGIVVPPDTRDAHQRLVVEFVFLWYRKYHHPLLLLLHGSYCRHVTVVEKAPLTMRVDVREATEKKHYCGPSRFSRPIPARISVPSRGQVHTPEQHLQVRSWWMR
jgi:hypothetical protein